MVASVDFSGKWVLDLAASDMKAMDEFLQVRGVGWMKRTLVGKATPTMVIDQTKEEITVATVTPFQTLKKTLKLDGSSQKDTDDLSGIEGDVTCTIIDGLWSVVMVLPNETTFTVDRTLEDGNLIFIIRYSVKGKTGVVRRVFIAKD